MSTQDDAQDDLGRDIDRLDNLYHATNLPMSADFHLKQLREALPEVIEDLKKHYAAAFGENPWE